MGKFKIGDSILVTKVHPNYSESLALIGTLAEIKDIDNDKDGFNYWVDVQDEINVIRASDGGFAWVEGVIPTSLMKELV